MNNLFSDKLKKLTPYTPGEQLNDKRYIKLNTNENPYPPSDKVLEAIKDKADETLRLYPDPESKELLSVIAKKYSIDNDMAFVSNGSDETLAFAFNAFFSGKKVAFPKITYSFYPVYCKLYDAKEETPEMNYDYTIDKEAVSKCKYPLIIANPNAPTGELLSNEYICSLLEKDKERLILVDEAYIDFANQPSMAEYVKKYKNLLVVRTFSKSYSLAGMRIGYAIGDKALITALNTVKNCFNSYPLDRLAQISAVTALNNQEYYDGINNKVKATRDRVAKQLEKLGCTVLPSQSNFLFVKFGGYDSRTIYTKFKDEGILIRQWNYIPDYVRISIGTDSDMDSLINTAKEIMK
jgi:histidinol-phosphate aminotransferase